MWLDSCESSHVDSRFDILVWQPIFTMTTVDKNTTITNCKNSQTLISTDDPLSLLHEINSLLFSPSENDSESKKNKSSNLPFLGGAVGYFSYDLGRRFEQLPQQAIKDITQPDMAIGFYDQALMFDRKEKRFYLVCPPNKQAALTKEITTLVNIKQDTTHFSLTSAWQMNMSRNEYEQKFTEVQNYLLSGDCYQINLAQRFSATYQGNEFKAYQ